MPCFSRSRGSKDPALTRLSKCAIHISARMAAVVGLYVFYSPVPACILAIAFQCGKKLDICPPLMQKTVRTKRLQRRLLCTLTYISHWTRPGHRYWTDRSPLFHLCFSHCIVERHISIFVLVKCCSSFTFPILVPFLVAHLHLM